MIIKLYKRLELKKITTIVKKKGLRVTVYKPIQQNHDPLKLKAKIHAHQYAYNSEFERGKPSMMFLLKETEETKYNNTLTNTTEALRNNYEAYILPLDKQYEVGTKIRGHIESESYLIHKVFKDREHSHINRYLLSRIH